LSNPNIELAISYYEALNRRDFDAYNVLFADDLTFEAVGGVAGSGLETVKFFDNIWPAAFSDFTVEGIYHLGDGNRVVCTTGRPAPTTASSSCPTDPNRLGAEVIHAGALPARGTVPACGSSRCNARCPEPGMSQGLVPM
jgi:hypothetical protein